jgi:hypothetical protein
MSAWTSNAGLIVQQTEVLSGAFAARGTTTNGATSASRTLPSIQPQLYYRIRFKLVSAAPQGVYLLRARTSGNTSLVGVFISSSGKLSYRNDIAGVTTTTTSTVPVGAWHELQAHVAVNGTSGLVELWLDGTAVSSTTENLGTTGIGRVQLGENATAKTYDVAFDDVLVSTGFIEGGAQPPTPTPAPPTNTPTTAPTDTPVPPTATAVLTDTPVQPTATAVLTDTPIPPTATTVLTDTPVPPTSTVAPPTDTAVPTDTVVATATPTATVPTATDTAVPATDTPVAPTPTPTSTPGAGTVLFADGFESGTMSAWTTNAGITVQQAEVFTGAWAGRGTSTGSATAAYRSLGSDETELYYRIRFKVINQGSSSVTLLRLRTGSGTTGSSLLGVLLSSSGKLSYRNDIAGATTTTTTSVSAGAWHELQVHATVNGTSGLVELWFDGTAVSSKTENLGTTGIGRVQLGENATAKTYDVAFDDVLVSTGFIDSGTLPPTPTPVAPTSTPTVTPTPPAGPGVVVVAAGDIACGNTSVGAKCKQGATSDLVLAQNPAAVLTLGDTQYECGETADFSAHFDPTWGRFKSIIRPSIGNHEYAINSNCPKAVAGAPGYWTYFGDATTPLQPGCRTDCHGYYSFDVGTWHIVVLNSNCSQAGGCGVGSAQEKWLRADLAAHPTTCSLAYMHHPRFSSGQIGSFTSMQPLWQAFYDNGGDLVLTGHDHDYERFAPQSPGGQLDMTFGIREFVVGTGGRNTSSLGTIKANSEVRNTTTFGILKLVLRPTGYDWQFLPIVGSSFTDSGSTDCHGIPGAADVGGTVASGAAPGGSAGLPVAMAVGSDPAGQASRGHGADPVTLFLTALPAVALVGSRQRVTVRRRRARRMHWTNEPKRAMEDSRVKRVL